MTFSSYGSVGARALGVCACEYLLVVCVCGGCWGDVEQAQCLIAPGIIFLFAITCSSQSKAATCT